MKWTTQVLIVALFGLVSVQAHADDKKSSSSSTKLVQTLTPLKDLVAAVSSNAPQPFLIAPDVPAVVGIGPMPLEAVTYPIFLDILANNELAAVRGSNVTSIVRARAVRQYPMPVITDDDSMIGADGEWVTRGIVLDNVAAASLVRELGPLLPAAGHLAANKATNTLIIVDRAGNVRRVVALARDIDARHSAKTPSGDAD
mgnify:CR=1 FL=1